MAAYLLLPRGLELRYHSREENCLVMIPGTWTARWRRALLALALLATVGARGAAAEILFQEDFDDANLAQRGWYDMAGWGTQLRFTTTEHLNGAGSVEVRYPAGGTGPWMRHQFPG